MTIETEDVVAWLTELAEFSEAANGDHRRGVHAATVTKGFRRATTLIQSLSERIAVLDLAERKWRELDPHGTSVIRGVPDDFYGDDPRINVFDEKIDAGEKPKLTVGLFLGEHKWAMQRFSPEQLIGIVGLILSRPSVRASLIKEGTNG